MVEYLGIMWDCHKAQKGISQTKVHRIRQQVRKLTQKGFWTWREARALLGRLNFAAFVIPLGRLHCRRAQRASNRIPQFSKRRYTIPKAVIQDLHWWLRNVDQSSLIWVLKKMSYLTTDASDWGWGATLNDLVISGKWNAKQLDWHCNCKELWAVLESVRRNALILSNQTILLQTDNRTVLAYIIKEGGTKSGKLLELTTELLETCQTFNITIQPQYIPGKYNSTADHLSRGRLLPDWSLSKIATQQLFRKWGTPEVDLFATNLSAVVPNYVTMDATDHKAYFINAFSRQWVFRLAWIFPPPALIPRVLKHLNSAVGSYIMIAPRWEKVFWRPDLRDRAIDGPILIPDLRMHLKDLTTDLPPPRCDDLRLEAWKVQGGRHR
nr:unnamed protein product [Callosobruchus analis]